MFPVVTVPDTAALLSEQLGSKHKFWFQHGSSIMYLFKEVRLGTGEDWSEKVACELCYLLDLPHVHYDLAIWKRRRGVVCPMFVPGDGQLRHGNELLVHLLPGYPRQQLFGVSEHTLEHVFAILQDVEIQMPIGWTPFTGSAFYASSTDTRPMSTLSAFEEVGRRRPRAAQAWIARLERLSA